MESSLILAFATIVMGPILAVVTIWADRKSSEELKQQNSFYETLLRSRRNGN